MHELLARFTFLAIYLSFFEANLKPNQKIAGSIHNIHVVPTPMTYDGIAVVFHSSQCTQRDEGIDAFLSAVYISPSGSTKAIHRVEASQSVPTKLPHVLRPKYMVSSAILSYHQIYF